MKTILKLLLCLGATIGVRGANFLGEQTLAAPYAVNEPVNVVGALTLAMPGVYSATTWNLVGPLRLAAPGDYVLVATAGSVSLTGAVNGPAGGRATLHVSYARTFNLVGATANNVSLVDDTRPAPTEKAAAPLTNLSTRATLSPGGVLSVGFVIGEGPPQRVLVRAIGPGLAQFGVERTLADPQLEVFRGAERIAGDDNSAGDLANAGAGAFPVEPGGKDAAILLTLPPGAYTVAIKAVAASDAGEVLAEIYLVP